MNNAKLKMDENPISLHSLSIQSLKNNKTQERITEALEKVNYLLAECDFHHVSFFRGMEFFRDRLSGRDFNVTAPYDARWESLWAQEPWGEVAGNVLYQQDCEGVPKWEDVSWRASVEMPREHSRFFLILNNIFCERLRDITESEAFEEGIIDAPGGYTFEGVDGTYDTPTLAFRAMWNAKNMVPKLCSANEWVTEPHYVSYPWNMDDFHNEFGGEVVIDKQGRNPVWNGKYLKIIPNPFVWVLQFSEVNYG